MDLRSLFRDSFLIFLCKITKQRIIYQVHGGAFPDKFTNGNHALKKLIKYILKNINKLILLSDIAKREYSSFESKLPIVVIPNAIDLSPFAHFSPKMYNNKNINAVYIGRLERNKGIYETIEAVSILIKEDRYKNLRLLIAGSGPDEKLLRRKAHFLKTEENVIFLGPIFGDEKINLWHIADFFIFPTYHQEGIPYSILESLASATPVITTQIGGIPEVIEDGVHGIFINPKDVTGLTVAVSGLINDHDKLVEISQNCRKRAFMFYGIERLESQFRDLYKELIG